MPTRAKKREELLQLQLRDAAGVTGDPKRIRRLVEKKGERKRREESERQGRELRRRGADGRDNAAGIAG